jgi:hypothetical protein
MATLPRLPDVILRDQSSDRSSSRYDASGRSPSTVQATVAADGALVPVIYGRQRVGAKIFACAVSGDYLYLGCLWCVGPVQAIESVTVGDKTVTWGGSTYAKTDYLGSVVQGVDPWLAAVISGYSDTLVVSVGGTQVPMCYSVVKVKANDEGFPTVEAVIQGRKVYDPRTGTAAYSRNPALCLADWITNPVYGQGLTVNWDSVDATADVCDETVGGGGRRTLDLVIDSELPVAQWTDILRAYAACFVSHDGSAIRLIPDAPVAASSRSLTMGDIVAGSLQLRRLGARQRPSVYQVTYTDNSAVPWRTATVQAKLAGVDLGTVVRSVESATLPGITSAAMAYREAVERLNIANTTDLEASWLTFDEGAADLVGDVVDLTHDLGLTAQQFRVIDVVLDSPGRWLVSARQYSAGTYSDATSAPSGGSYTALPDPGTIPALSGLTATSGTAWLFRQTDGTIISRIYVTWTAPTYVYAVRIEVQFKRTTDTAWATAAIFDTTSAICAPVQDGVTYDIRARLVNSLGQAGTWASLTHVVVGKTELPPDVDTFMASIYADGTRQFTFSMASPPVDLAGYQIRYVAASSGTWASMTDLHTGLLMASPYETNALAGGQYTFAIKARDATGNWSANATYVTVTLPDGPMGATLAQVDAYTEGWTGTKTNAWVAEDGVLYATDSKTWAALGTDGITWATWTAWARDANDLTYVEQIDLGAVITFTPVVTVTAPVGTLTVEHRTSDDGSTWSSWAAYSSAVQTARYYEARASLTGTAGQQLRLLNFSVLLTGDPVEEVIEDLATASLSGSYRIGTGDIRLPLTEDFSACTSVFITLQNVGAGWSWELIDKVVTYGPRIKIYNASKVAADATIDALIRGY